MRILLAHNIYKHEGGEESVFANEKELLIRRSHECEFVVLKNRGIRSIGNKIKVAFSAPWSKIGYKKAAIAIQHFSPDIVHVHNFFPLFTPAIYNACIESGLPVVQTLHNFRTICANALFLRNGTICENCITGSPYQAMIFRCYRKSIFGSFAVARMIAYHRKRKTWQNFVDRFIALTDFAKEKFIQAGFPEQKVSVKPNFFISPTLTLKSSTIEENWNQNVRKGGLFVGRLSSEKGIKTLLSAWRRVNISLRLAGDGPLLSKKTEHENKLITFLGKVNKNQIYSEMKNASFLLMPSIWYEGFPMVLVEAFAHGLPIVASRLGSMAEIVSDGITGLHFEAGNPKDLAEKVMWMHNHPDACRKMGENARREYEKKYTPERNYEMLMDIYTQAIEEKRATRNK